MELPVSFGQQIHPLHDRPGYVGSRQSILGGIEVSGQSCRQQVLLNYDAYDATGTPIAAVSFPAILEGGITLEHTWVRAGPGDERTSLEDCADIASFELNSSSLVF